MRLVYPMRHSPGTEQLHLCRACERPFVVPVCVVDLLDGDRAVVELHCTNCDRTVLGVHSDASLEALDRELDATTQEMHESLALLKYVRELQRIGEFAAALERDLILPEDF